MTSAGVAYRRIGDARPDPTAGPASRDTGPASPCAEPLGAVRSPYVTADTVVREGRLLPHRPGRMRRAARVDAPPTAARRGGGRRAGAPRDDLRQLRPPLGSP